MRPSRALRSALLTAVLVIGVPSCGTAIGDSDTGAGDRSTTDPGSTPRPPRGAGIVQAGWWKILDDQFEGVEDMESTVPTIDMDGRCELGGDIEVDGQRLRLFGTGASAFGESGRRYICQFSDPVSVDVIVARFTEPGEYDDLKASLAADGFSEVQVDDTAFQVLKNEAPNGAHTDFEVVHLVDDRDGFVRLDLELTDDAQRSSFTDEQAAEVLSRFLRG